MCHKDFVLKDIQVDHITPAGSLQKTEDIQGFVERLLYVTEGDLRLVCKGCNAALAMGDKYDMTYEEALVEKLAINLIKNKIDKEYILSKNAIPASNQKARRVQIIELLKEEMKDE